MSTDLSTGVFSNLNKIFSELVGMHPEQIAKANAPDFLKIAAMEQQAQLRKSPAVPPTSTVAAQVVNRAANPEAAQPQMQTGGYVHDYGVATLPYKPNYEHGGIVSFDEGGYADIASNALGAGANFIMENPAETALALAALTPGRAYGKGLQLLKTGASKIFKGGNKLKALSSLTPRLAALGLAGYGLSPDEQQETPVDAGSVKQMAAPQSTPTEEPKLSVPGIAAPQYNFEPIDVNAIGLVAPNVSDFVDPVEAMKAKGIDSEKYFKEREASTQDKLNKAKERLKSSFTSEGLMNLGAAIASGKSANMMENIFGAIPEYTKTIKEESDRYGDYRDKYESALDSLKDAKYASDRGDAQLSIAAKQAYDDKVTDAFNKLNEQQNAIRIQNAGLKNLKIEKEADAYLEVAKANLSASTAMMAAQIEANASYARKAQENSTKGSMSDDKLTEFISGIERTDPTLQILKADFGKNPTEAQLAAYEKAKEQSIIHALWTSKSYGTLARLGYDLDQVQKAMEGNQATVTQIGNKSGGLLSLARQ